MMTLFRVQKSESLRERDTTQSYSGIEEDLLPTQHTHVSRSTTYGARPSPAVFEQLEHWRQLVACGHFPLFFE